jgi:amino acid adenylation domain-containing protein
MFHQLFEAQAHRRPDRCALIYQGNSLTYRELNERANQLAHYLRSIGVGPDVLVGICLERSLERIISLLAVLKAGGAYVPLDPEYLTDRLAFMLADSAAPVLLTSTALAAQLPTSGITTLCLDDFSPTGRVDDLRNDAAPHNLAYVIYTSGSTGPPKGAMIHHAGLANYLIWAVDAYAAEAGCGAPSHSSISFDLTITSIFVPLLAGRTVELVPAGPGVHSLAAVLRQKREFSFVKLTPAHLELLRREFQPDEVAGQTLAFVVGGENLFGDTIAFWQENAPDTTFFNEYGPTETVVGCCMYQVPRGRRFTGAVPIGKPIANAQMHVLDEYMRAVSPGDVGELYIGGDCVGRGYLNRPQLTAERFLPDPWSDERDARLYRSGDLVRRLSDGNLEFVGRIDDQVKIRGYRVEPGEVDAVVRQSVDVRDVVTVVVGNRHKRLITYAVPQPGKTLNIDELRAFIALKLPDFMIPSLFVSIDGLPLDPNGKVDRSALPPPHNLTLPPGVRTTSPVTALQLKLVKIWESVLHVAPIGIHDNFFDLGGDSLSAVGLFCEIEKELGKDLPLATLLRNPTVEQLAETIREETWSQFRSSLVPIQLRGPGAPFFCVHAAGGNVLNYFDLARRFAGQRAFYGLQAQGLDGRDYPYRTVEEMAARYIGEIRSVQPSGPYFIGGESFGGVVAFEMARQLRTCGEKVPLLALLDAPVDPTHLQSLLKKLYGRVRVLFRLSPNKRYKYIAEQLRMAGSFIANRSGRPFLGQMPASSNGLPSALQNVARVNDQAHALYVPGPYAGRAILFVAQESWWSGDLGWSRLVTGGLDVREVPGGHNDFVGEPYVSTLAQQLLAAISAAEKEDEQSHNSSGDDSKRFLPTFASHLVGGTIALGGLSDLLEL